MSLQSKFLKSLLPKDYTTYFQISANPGKSTHENYIKQSKLQKDINYIKESTGHLKSRMNPSRRYLKQYCVIK